MSAPCSETAVLTATEVAPTVACESAGAGFTLCSAVCTDAQILADVLCTNSRRCQGPRMTEDWRHCGSRSCKTWACWAAAAAASRAKSGTFRLAACCASRWPPTRISDLHGVILNLQLRMQNLHHAQSSLQDATMHQLL